MHKKGKYMHTLQKMILQNAINENKLHKMPKKHVIVQGGPKVLPQVIEKFVTQCVTI